MIHLHTTVDIVMCTVGDSSTITRVFSFIC